jgi:hypothetical protein
MNGLIITRKFIAKIINMVLSNVETLKPTVRFSVNYIMIIVWKRIYVCKYEFSFLNKKCEFKNVVFISNK